MSEPRGDVLLSASVAVDGDRIRLGFSVHNGRDEAVYVLAHPGDFERSRVRHDEAYVEYEEDEGRILVSLVPPDPPLEADFGVGVESLSRRLPPGDDYSSVIVLELPVQPWDPYLEALSGSAPGGRTSEGDLPTADRIRLETRWMPESGGVLRQPGPEPDTWWFVGTGGGPLVADLRLPHPVPVAVAPPDAGPGS